MLTSLKWRGLALVATVALLGGTALVASGATGAYFSDTHTGTLTGSTGSIEVDASGGGGAEGLDFSLDDLLPGDPESFTVHYANSGISPQDVWIVFDPADPGFASLSLAGDNATVDITSSDGASFSSTDLTANPLPPMIKVHTNLAPSASGSATGTFGIAASVSDPAAEGLTGLALEYSIVATQVGILPGATG